jgi:hypothetical protein
MVKSVFILFAFLLAAYFFMDQGPTFVIPEAAAGSRSNNGIKKYEFDALFERNRPLSKLAKKGYYTVIEGYIDTCSICKRLEADFPGFLKQRKDVLIRKVHFPEGGVRLEFTGNSQEEVNRQLAEYYQRLGKYNFNHVVKTDTEYQLTSCGTPHIEIYGPDKELIATDKCGEKNLKEGLQYLRNWIKAEKSHG